eukprot:g11489.t1
MYSSLTHSHSHSQLSQLSTVVTGARIAESVRPEDWVMLKVDIEGAEYNLLPCLAQFKDAGLIDRMYLEEHWWFPSVTEQSKSALAQSKKQLLAKHVDIPQYYSET